MKSTLERINDSLDSAKKISELEDSNRSYAKWNTEWKKSGKK